MQWSQFIQECKESGLSVAEFCRDAGVRPNTYYYWQKKLRDEACQQLVMSRAGTSLPSFAATAPQGFTEVQLRDASPSQPLVLESTQSDTNDKEAIGQIRIDVATRQIIADATYPTEKLALLLRELM